MVSFGFFNSAPMSSLLETFPLILMMILFGVGLSIPALWLYNLLFRELKEGALKVYIKKLILSVVGASFIWITFYLFKSATLYSLTWPGIYTMVLLVSTFIFRMDGKKAKEIQ